MSAFVHHELNTSDPAAAKKFYKGLFGWKLEDMKMPDGSVYTMFKTGPKEGGGIWSTRCRAVRACGFSTSASRPSRSR